MEGIDKLQSQDLKQIARRLRSHIVKMVGEAGSGHPGGSLSAVEILATLYFNVMKVDPENPDWPDRDRFILSKGHAAPALYAALAEKGYFPTEKLITLRKLGSPLQGHPDRKSVPGVEVSTGSLGHGLAVANGMALAARLDNRNYNVYVLLGDGEIQEGMVWEAAMAAAHYKLDNLIAIVDHNHLQIDGKISEVMSPEPVAEKFKAFGWSVQTIDGHDFDQIQTAIENAKKVQGKPSVIIAETVKGKGISFMENEADWHGKAPKSEELNKALAELDGQENGQS
ncbi:MAG: transketolase [Clostridia bacterium]|nr:transketolase [Clostridia bacterium]